MSMGSIMGGGSQEYRQAAEEMRRLREEYDQLKQSMQTGQGPSGNTAQLQDMRRALAEARQEAERANEIFSRAGGVFRELGNSPPSKELRNYIKQIGDEASRAGDQIQKKLIEPLAKGGPGGPGGTGGGRFGGAGLYGFMYMLDDLQYVGQMGLRPVINNLMMIHPVLGMIALASDQVVRNWDQLEALWTGDSATKTQAEQMKELAKATALTVDEARKLSSYQREESEGRRLINQPTAAQSEQEKLFNAALSGLDVGEMEKTISSSRSNIYTKSQQREINRLEAAKRAMEAGEGASNEDKAAYARVFSAAGAGGYFKAPSVSISDIMGLATGGIGGVAGSIAAKSVDVDRYMEARRKELELEGQRAKESQVSREFVQAQRDPEALRRLIAESEKIGGAGLPPGLAKIASGEAMSPKEVAVGINEFMHQQQRYIETSEDGAQKISRLRESADEYKAKIDQVNESMGTGIIDAQTGSDVQIKLADAMRRANEQAEDLSRAHDVLIQKMNEESEAAQQQKRDKELDKETSDLVKRGSQAYAGAFGFGLSRAMSVAGGRGESAEAVDARLRTQLMQRMQSVPEGQRAIIAEEVVRQVRERNMAMGMQFGAGLDAQRAAVQAGLARPDWAAGIAQRQALAEAQKQVLPGDAGIVQRQLMAGQFRPKDANVLQAKAETDILTAKRLEFAANKIAEASDRLASGDIKVKF